MTKDRSGWPLMLAAFALVVAIAFAGLTIQPRPSAGDFSADRAVERLSRILGDQRPHPVDTPANDAVRSRLLAELRAIGLHPQIQEATDCSGFPKSRTVSCSHVRNVVAIIPGDAAQKALLINAHYDSTPTGPGAADDGIGVAVTLEVARQLVECGSSAEIGGRARQRGSTSLDANADCLRRRPVILLFNEGEEFGLNGASAFIGSDLAKRVDRLINIEARGVSGPAIMFQTSTPNGPALADYAAASARPFANSMSADFSRLIPNSTDVTKFMPMGWRILNYSNIGNETRYHTPGDDLAHLDRDSVAHMGDEVLAAARRMAAPDRSVTRGDVIYTDVAGYALLHLPLLLGALLLGGLTTAALVLVHRRRAWRSLGRIVLAFIASVIVASIVATLVGLFRPGDYWRAYPWLPTLAVAATVISVQMWLVLWAAPKADRTQLRLAAWTLVLLFAAVVGILMPGATIFFIFAPALGLLGVKWRPMAWLGAVVQLVMLGELVALIELTLIDGPTYSVAPLIALISLPILTEVGRSRRWPHMVLALSSLALWTACLLIPRASTERPLAMTIDHVQDERRGTAHWAIASKQAPLPPAFDRLGPWIEGPLPHNKRPRWLAKAPLMEGARGNIVLRSNIVSDGKRHLRLRLDRAGADSLVLRFDEDVPVLAMGLPGTLRAVDPHAAKAPSILRCTGRRCDGLEVEILLATAAPVTMMLVATSFAPPPEAAPLIAARPVDAQPQYSPDSQVRIRAIRL